MANKLKLPEKFKTIETEFVDGCRYEIIQGDTPKTGKYFYLLKGRTFNACHRSIILADLQELVQKEKYLARYKAEKTSRREKTMWDHLRQGMFL